MALSQKHWALIGRLAVAVITVVSAGAAGLYYLGQLTTGPRVVLEAEAGPFYPLPDFRYDEVVASAAPDSLAADLLDARLDSADIGWLTERLSRRFKSYGSAPYVRGFMKGVVRNDGNRPATGVVVTVDGGTYAAVDRSGGTTEVERIDGVVEVGSLRSQEEVELLVWLDSPYSAFPAPRVTLVHDGGIGVVTLGLPVAGLGLRVGRFFDVFGGLPLILAVSVGLLLILPWLWELWTSSRGRPGGAAGDSVPAEGVVVEDDTTPAQAPPQAGSS